MSSVGKDERTIDSRRRRLDERIRAAISTRRDDALSIPVRSDRGPAPLTFAQERLWVLEQVGTVGAAYNMPELYQVEGELDIAALERAYQEVIRRHASLRTRFVASDGEPKQIVEPAVSFKCSFRDLTTVCEGDRLAEADKLIQVAAIQPFDLTVAPLLRVLVLRLSEHKHRLAVVLHHIVGDGWSMELLAREVKLLYSSFVDGKSVSLPELRIQYADFAFWQRGWMQGKVLDEHFAYWIDKLKGAPGTPLMPTDRPRPAVQTYNGGTVSITLNKDLVLRLSELARGGGATLFMVLLAAFKIILSRWSGEDDIVVGTPIKGRIHQDVEEMIGLFVNMMALRTSVEGEPSFREFLQRVKRTALGAYAHQETPYERLLEELRPARTLSHSPVFQCVINMLNFGAGEADQSRLQLKTLVPRNPISRFDLTLYVVEFNKGLQLSAVFNPDLFLPARISEFLGQLSVLLEQIVKGPDQPISAFSLLTPAAKKVLPAPEAPLEHGWRGAIHERFGIHARRQPDRTAIVTPTETYSYCELDQLSNDVARTLRECGIGKGDIVAIYACRGAAIVYAILGILKAGGAFTILDPSYPAARLIACIEVAQPRGWIEIAEAGQPVGAVAAAAMRACHCRLVIRGRQMETIAKEAMSSTNEQASVVVGPDDLAVVTFTSGSTGVPKGVEGRHGPLTYFVPWLEKAFGLGRDDRFSMVSGISHDPLQRDIFTPLCLGATICIPRPDDIVLPGRMAKWMAANDVTVSHLTPGLGQALSHPAAGWGGGVAERPTIGSLRYAFFVGDALTRSDIAAIKEIAPLVTCINYYGSTETQRSVGYHIVSDDTSGDSVGSKVRAKQILPLGRGIEGVQLLLLNCTNQQAGIGELAEIYVRSHHLARGYIRDPAGTEGRFLANPFSKIEGDRLYRTGDLGRYLPDGSVEFAGRVDDQMKIRGYRVEPGEIESVLSKVSGVRDAFVTLRTHESDEKTLVAYIVPADRANTPATTDLRTHLRAFVPDYMIPSTFVMLDELPLTPNGKVDRRSLPDPDIATQSDSWKPRRVPRTETEKSLVPIWQRVLGQTDVGIDDNFFELGGHSLRAARVIAWVQQELQVDLPLRTMFEAPTIMELASWIDERRGAGATNMSLPGVHPRPPILPVSLAQEALLRLYRAENPGAAYNIAYFVGLRGPLDAQSLQRSFDAVLRRHESLRTHFQWVDDAPIQVIDPPGTFKIDISDIASLPAVERNAMARRLALEARDTSFDLERGPLVRVTLLRLSAEDHHLLILMHHTVSDGWSVQVLLKEIRALYDAFCAGKPACLPLPPVQYPDFALWQRTSDYRNMIVPEIDYWVERLINAPLLNLPSDRPRPSRVSYRGATRPLTLSPGLTEKLRLLAGREGATPFMLLFAAFACVVSRWSGETDLVIGVPTAGRPRPSMEESIGMFINMIPLRIGLCHDPSFRELLRRAKTEILAGLEHPNPSIAEIETGLQRRGHRRAGPLFRVAFAMQNVPIDKMVLTGLRTYPVEVPVGSSRRDLTLFVYDSVGVFHAVAEYATDIFETDAIEQFLGRFADSLKIFADDPGLSISAGVGPANRRHAEEVSIAADLK